MDILGMSREDLLKLDPESVDWQLSEAEILHIFSAFGGFWQYDYEAAKAGFRMLPLYHAELKSGRCSDGFLYSKTVLSHLNLCELMARQMVLKYKAWSLPRPDYVVGVPDGATELGKCFARLIGAKVADMVKEDGIIKFCSLLPADAKLLFVEDFCTKGTGLKEAREAVLSVNNLIHVMPFEPVIVNRGGLQEIRCDDNFSFLIVAPVTYRINDWEQSQCPLCKAGSKRIRPKKNWDILEK